MGENLELERPFDTQPEAINKKRSWTNKNYKFPH